MGRKPIYYKKIFVMIFIGFLTGSLLGTALIGWPASLKSQTQGSASVLLASTSGTYSSHMVFIILENHPLSSVTCAGCAPYMMSLANTYTNGTNYVGSVNSNWDPSLPNYLGLLSGQIWGCAGYDGAPHSNTCTNNAWNCASPCNLVDRFSSAGVTWKGYMEGMPDSNICNGGGSSDGGPANSSGRPIYVAHHNPFVYFSNIASNSTRCPLVVQSGSSGGPTSCGTLPTTAVVSNLVNDLNGTAPNLSWVTPNRVDDSHDCSMSQASGWLSVVVPAILTTKTFKNDSSATIVITFDEPTTGTYGTTPIYFAVLGPGAKSLYTSSTKYTHLNWLATVESNWSLRCLKYECGLATMSEFFSAAASSRLAFGSPAQTLTADVCSAKITVQNQNSSGSPSNVVANTVVGLTTSSSDGKFYSDTACATTITSVTIAGGSSSASLFYRDTTAGSPTITASATGLTSATQTETINAAGPSSPGGMCLECIVKGLSSPFLLAIGLVIGLILTASVITVAKRRNRAVIRRLLR